MIFQDPMSSLDPVCTRWATKLIENIRLHTDLSRRGAARQPPGPTEPASTRFGHPRPAGPRLRTYPHQMSGGQRQTG